MLLDTQYIERIRNGIESRFIKWCERGGPVYGVIAAVNISLGRDGLDTFSSQGQPVVLPQIGTGNII